VGPFRARGLAPALDALTAIFVEIKRENGEVFAALGTAGMLCARFVRGSTSALSNHSWGTAIDLTLDGHLDQRGDARVQVGSPASRRSSTGMAGSGARASGSRTRCTLKRAMS
jgi:D-alanyl-D-alanine dipeptidase